MYREVEESPPPRGASMDTHRGSRLSIGESVFASTILSMEQEQERKAPRLNDQQWVLQRKRIGLSRKSKKTREAAEQREQSKARTIAFYRSNFSSAECVQ